ncbi:MAG: hypothetical protein Ct9H300mP28_09770 [Pseudomonadota bacterium]|nr:MAG: hypothetical protein Ct9H300mP28_09770 [Pseudomonadota bacterium]
MGYMFLAMGVGAFTTGVFHVMTHAFFKALLFLGSGSVILAVHHEQDMRKMGALKNKLPITYITMLLGTMAISGIPSFQDFSARTRSMVCLQFTFWKRMVLGYRFPDCRLNSILYVQNDLFDISR